MPHEFDVIVVGARVAGSATAMLLARQGHRVLLVDRVHMPSDTVSTHAILRTGVLQLRRWGLLDRVLASGTPPVGNVVLGFGDERIPIRLRAEHGIEALCAPRRHVLDGLLVDAATEAGVELRDAARVTDLIGDRGGRVSGAVIGHGSGTSTVSARLVIGADGVNSRIASLVDASTYESHAPTNAVHYAYFTGIDHDGFWFQFTPGVNAGLVPTNDGAACVFAGRPPKMLPAFRTDPETEFVRLLQTAGADLAEVVTAASRVSPFRGTPGLPGFIRQPWGPGWALVGDAGYTKDPISAHGISDALRDAELCARAVDRGLREPYAEARAMAEYQLMRDSLSWPMFRASRALAAYGWTPQEASRLMRDISEAVRVECGAIVALPEWPALVTSTAA